MKKLILFIFLSFAALIIFPQESLAQTATSSAAVRYNLTFPISSLGNCGSISECKVFCDKPENASACQTFAKQKNLYQANPVAIAAKTVLGCDISTSSCKEYCARPENHSACKLFAEKYLKSATPSATIATTQSQAEICNNFCAANPEQCKPKNLPLGKYAQLESICKNSGCTWANFNCACPQITAGTSSATASSTLINRVLPVVQGVSVGPNLIQLFFMLLRGSL